MYYVNIRMPTAATVSFLPIKVENFYCTNPLELVLLRQIKT